MVMGSPALYSDRRELRVSFFRLGADEPMGEWELNLPCVFSSWAASRGFTALRGVERA